MRQSTCIFLVLTSVLSACGLDAADTRGLDDVTGEEATAVAPQALASDQSIYTDGALAAPWRDWSWSMTVALANADAPLLATSRSHVKATSRAAWAALALAHATSDVLVDDYDSIAFDVRAPSTVTLQLAIEPLAGGTTAVRANVPVTTGWTRQTVKLSAVAGSLTRFGKIDWIATQGEKTFYVDNVKLVAKTSATSPVVTPPSSPVPSPTFPATPLAVKKRDVVTLTYSGGSYSLFVPDTYDATHGTPTPVLLWMHGCGGHAYGDAWVVSPGGAQRWMAVSVGGRDGKCWNVGTDAALALGALDDVAKRLNVDPRRVVIGGYSSGGDMAYRTAFTNAKRFAGLIAVNTTPFRDTGSSQATSIAAAAWKFNVAHLAHTGDTTYPIARVRTETDALKAAGFPMTRIERAGTHYDQDTATSGTTYDLRKYLLPYVDAGWIAPL